jgi:hypothetical protein
MHVAGDEVWDVVDNHTPVSGHLFAPWFWRRPNTLPP